MSTPMKDSEKKWIDEASYYQLLKKWRFTCTAPGDSIFTGESGEYYSKVMHERRAEVGPAEHTRVSKAIGWTP